LEACDVGEGTRFHRGSAYPRRHLKKKSMGRKKKQFPTRDSDGTRSVLPGHRGQKREIQGRSVVSDGLKEIRGKKGVGLALSIDVRGEED